VHDPGCGPGAHGAGHSDAVSGQEFLESGWFQDSVPLDSHKSEEFSGLVRMYRDLIYLRLNLFGSTRGLTGSGLNTFHENQADNLIAYHRWHHGGPGDDVVVVVNLSHLGHENYTLGFSVAGDVALTAEQ
jgi:1,4-alpha-glucan branching enzyme